MRDTSKTSLEAGILPGMRALSSAKQHLALAKHAEALCLQEGMAMTPLRREVYELLLAHDRPVGAYELLEELKAKRPKAAPVTVYRALDFLLELGVIHKVNALNAFSACRGLETAHRGLVLICRTCRTSVELEDHKVDNTIKRSAAAHGFETSDEPIEVLGMCASCRT